MEDLDSVLSSVVKHSAQCLPVSYSEEHLGYKCPRQDFFPIFPSCATMEKCGFVACGLDTG